MKKVGIAADNYKVTKFKKELTKAEFTFTKNPFTKDTTFFSIECEDHQVSDVKKLCEKVEFHFKRAN